MSTITFGRRLDELDGASCENHEATVRVHNAGFDESGGTGTSIYACRRCVGAVVKAMHRIHADVTVTVLGEPRPAEWDGQQNLFEGDAA